MNINEQSTNRPFKTVGSKYASFVPIEQWPARVSETHRQYWSRVLRANSVANRYTDVP